MIKNLQRRQGVGADENKPLGNRAGKTMKASNSSGNNGSNFGMNLSDPNEKDSSYENMAIFAAANGNGNDTIFFQGILEYMHLTLVMPSTGLVIEIADEKNRVDHVYDGQGGVDTLILTDLGDAVFIADQNGNQQIFNIENILGRDGDDIIILADPNLTYGNVTIIGEDGNDIIFSNVGDDLIQGGQGNDIIDGGAGNDILYGDEGDDYVSGGAGDDWIFGWVGNDHLVGGAGNDYIDGEDDIDTVDYSTSISGIVVELANNIVSDDGFGNVDTIFNVENVIGSAFNDHITGDWANNEISGGAGADYLNGGDGDDILHYSHDGDWTVSFWATNVGSPDAQLSGDHYVVITPRDNNYDVFVGGEGHDTLMMSDRGEALFLDNMFSPMPDGVDVPRISGIEVIDAGGGNDLVDLTSTRFSYGDVTILGGDGNDVLWSSAGNDHIYGGTGNDDIDGGSGNDVLYGGTGADVLYGRSGADTFVFEAADYGTGVDTVGDFSLAENDKLDISDVLQGFDPLHDAIADFVQITSDGVNSYLMVDIDGGGDLFAQLAVLNNVTDLDVMSMIASGNLLVGDAVMQSALAQQSSAGTAPNGTIGAQGGTSIGGDALEVLEVDPVPAKQILKMASLQDHSNVLTVLHNDVDVKSHASAALADMFH